MAKGRDQKKHNSVAKARVPGCCRWNAVLLLLVAASLLVSCGVKVPDPTPTLQRALPTVTVPFELPTVISVAGTFDDQTLEILDAQIAAFEVANPDIKVELVQADREPEDRYRAFARFLSAKDNTRDIYLVSATWLPEFSANGWLAPLNGYVEISNLPMSDFFPASLQASTVGSHLMALPWSVDGGMLYSRQDLLDRYGSEVPTTWADLQRLALDLQTREGLPYGLLWQAAPGETLTCNTLEFVWASGGQVLDPEGRVVFDSPETRAGLQQMVDLIASGASPAEVTSSLEPASLATFGSGQAILMRNGSYAWDRLHEAASPVAGKVRLSPLPASCLGGSSLALSAYSPHPDLAWRFMAFLVGQAQQAQLAVDGTQPPALETVYRDPELVRVRPVLPALEAALRVARPRPQSVRYSELSEVISTEVHQMLQGEQGVETTATTIQARLEEIQGPQAAHPRATSSTVPPTVTPQPPAAAPTEQVPYPAATAPPTVDLSTEVSPTPVRAPTAVPAQSPSSAPRILSFTVTPTTTLNVGDTLVITWEAQGKQAELCPVLGTGPVDCQPVALQGHKTWITDERAMAYVALALRVSTGSASTLSAVDVRLQCQNLRRWFFSSPPRRCPAEAPLDSQAAAQHFEHGLMIWVKETDTFYIFYYEPDGLGFQTFVWTIGLQLKPGASEGHRVGEQPPPGLHEPISGFGLIWRGEADWPEAQNARQRLGWATEPEFGFDAAYQCETPAHPHLWRCYLQAPGREVLEIFPDSSAQVRFLWQQR